MSNLSLTDPGGVLITICNLQMGLRRVVDKFLGIVLKNFLIYISLINPSKVAKDQEPEISVSPGKMDIYGG